MIVSIQFDESDKQPFSSVEFTGSAESSGDMEVVIANLIRATSWRYEAIAAAIVDGMAVQADDPFPYFVSRLDDNAQ